jgi:hypothetical protein
MTEIQTRAKKKNDSMKLHDTNHYTMAANSLCKRLNVLYIPNTVFTGNTQLYYRR